MATKRLSDLDGKLTKASFGAEILGDGVTAIPADGWYLVTGTATSGSTILATTGYPVYLTTAITPATDDNVKPITFTDLCFVQNASISFSKDELETTVLCDYQKNYVVGRSDVTGSFDGIAEAGNGEYAELVNKFLDTVIQTTGSVTISEANADIVYLQLHTNEGKAADNVPEQFYLLPATITSSSAGVTQGSAQTFSAGFRLTDDGVNGVKAVFVERDL